MSSRGRGYTRPKWTLRTYEVAISTLVEARNTNPQDENDAHLGSAIMALKHERDLFVGKVARERKARQSKPILLGKYALRFAATGFDNKERVFDVYIEHDGELGVYHLGHRYGLAVLAENAVFHKMIADATLARYR